MKTKILLAIILLASVLDVYSQFKINANGSAQFKVGSYLAGSTGDSGNSNVSFGYKTLNTSAVQNFNAAFGANALYSLTTGFGNTATGGEALYFNTVGHYNTATGYKTLYFNTSGHGNTATGVNALCYNTTGQDNTATGAGALHENTTGSFNNAHSTYSLPYNTTGSNNAAFGHGSLPNNTTGSLNTGYGSWSFRFNETGSYNTALGAYSLCGAGNLNNSTVIGYEAQVTSSNQVRIGSTSVTDIGGFANWTNVSDRRAKKNIRTDVPGLNFINRLQPITYNLDLDAIDKLLKIDRMENGKDALEQPLSRVLLEIKRKAREAKQQLVQTGFVAQDVEKTAQSIGYDFSGVNVDESGIYGLRYAEFVVPLVKAV
ncbi:MAG: tail fiber domain-containing protein [Dysgonamonadaceae bacterium]|jgi:hypothetical protein|nr:tail fiber domain-containing protein [Dysgonamonadaceae bacterium]